ncbi:zinc-dependent metalloprotease [Parvularcula sp. LCG005]|uniref:zinc-dependent metalloprotease n=1 Tax=Parvularcula sp. LCG005 TaxID=3078805 RepID=UPI002943D694|nr:zinc-dependent metalloprotease [Parvularcula sp. LCG005]WOI53777.1 zinc-dependent metalloprotease [Parvularcula sp. LCG005]
MMNRNRRGLDIGLLLLTSALSTFSVAQAQDDKKKDEGTPTIEKKVKDLTATEGLFDFYTDPKTGDVFMEISEDQLDQEFIAFSYTENGVLEAGHFKGAYRDQRVMSVNRHYGKLEFVEQSTAYYFDETNAISKAADANISPSIVAAADIIAITEGTDDATDRFLISANGLFLNEKLHKVSPTAGPFSGPFSFSVGGLSSEKTKFADIRAYPENVDVIVDYVFDNGSPTNYGSDAVTDARSVTVKMQHSFLAMPDEGFTPRLDDYRIGYFLDQVTDLTSADPAPYRDLIHRWRLEKKDPDAALSDPVKPITYWIENTTPVEYRDTIRDAVLTWNQAFEKAGFTNAIEVKVQPDDADWDAGDIRYNVLRWTSSPQPPFGGYGPSFTNPRTGEILGADIMLEYVFITNRMTYADVFDTAMIPASSDELEALPQDDHLCSVTHDLQVGNLFAQATAEAMGASDEEMEELVRQGLYYLLLHEVGHTLGLNHNMKASILYGPKEVHDKTLTQGVPVGSVMDYPAVNVAPVGMTQGDYYMLRPGPYDDWAIEFGYRPDLDDEARAALLAKSSERGYAFGNDADDMRAPGRGIDPRVMINDMSSDPVAYGIDRIKLANTIIDGLLDKYGDEDSWQKLVRGYLVASGQQATMAQIMSRQIGGIYVERIAPGQTDAAPFTPVPAETQKDAMKALGTYVFSPNAFAVSEELAARLQNQRRGFGFGGGTEDPKLHGRVLNIQMGVIDHLLNPRVLQRMTDSAVYGGDYSASEMLLDLNTVIYGADLGGEPNTFRRGLQTAYLERLIYSVDSPVYDPVARAAILGAIEDLRHRLAGIDFHLSAEARAHRKQLKRMLKWLDA